MRLQLPDRQKRWLFSLFILACLPLWLAADVQLIAQNNLLTPVTLSHEAWTALIQPTDRRWMDGRSRTW